MTRATPRLRAMVRSLLEREASSTEEVAFFAVEKLRAHLTKVLGVHGFHAILSRALALAKAEVPWLGRVEIQADGSLQGAEKQTKEDRGEAERAGEALLANLLGLLAAFIGEELILRLLRDVWPDASLHDFATNPEEGMS